MPNGDYAVGTGKVNSGLASRLTQGKPKGYSTGREMKRTAAAMKSKGMSVPSMSKVNRVHKEETKKGAYRKGRGTSTRSRKVTVV